ncbi:MAG: hypothetical protein HQ564_03345 [Candidatus Saganbacteria bacterium]|nr:hypothetical protein [Candidatus Saganbacteria bacterium]
MAMLHLYHVPVLVVQLQIQVVGKEMPLQIDAFLELELRVIASQGLDFRVRRK